MLLAVFTLQHASQRIAVQFNCALGWNDQCCNSEEQDIKRLNSPNLSHLWLEQEGMIWHSHFLYKF